MDWATKRESMEIKSESEYQAALKRLDVVFMADQSTPEGEEAAILVDAIEAYEDIHCPIGLPDPIEAIKIRMDELNLKQKDMIGAIGTKGRVSEVLSRKKRLTLEMVRGIHKRLEISLETLIQDYSLTDGK